ncbi:uncharacterized protein TNCV_3967351 [Trichonephila clavipes]|nr:uncharacterized protein TNCV_3967351 [Trichonephila clavipes]
MCFQSISLFNFLRRRKQSFSSCFEIEERRDQRDTPEIMDEILTTARDLELEVNEDDIEELIMGHEDELTTEELQEILNEEHQETQRNVSPSEQEED